MAFTVQFNQSNIRLDTKLQIDNIQFGAELQADNRCLDAEFAGFQKVTEFKDAEPYTGEYEITPKVEAQTMPTAQKLMTDDVKIKSIPYFDVSNASGGSTVYIAREV